MKRVWETDELLEHWALTQQERELAAKAKTETITLGSAHETENIVRLEQPGISSSLLTVSRRRICQVRV